ncbi:hypothetical protein LAZ67_15000137 [Cordylochernes scorpioides]|uniref:Uncharacterized protein n=1 Tax=Cordylochernes scorpioides TaxID=51811 RepID=A0ABY6L7T3_9ARAC|nr:hypothetical protein LAZ67_15000137 [Cordylochernes scorpioides]
MNLNLSENQHKVDHFLGWPMNITMPEMISKIHCIFKEDRRVNICQIAETTSISLDRVHHILGVKLPIKICVPDGYRDCLRTTKKACAQTFPSRVLSLSVLNPPEGDDILKEELRAKRPRLARKKVNFQHDNALPHRSNVAAAKLFELSFQLVAHSSYSPDLAPCDFFLFPNINKCLVGMTFSSNEEVINDVNGYFEDLIISNFTDMQDQKGLPIIEHVSEDSKEKIMKDLVNDLFPDRWPDPDDTIISDNAHHTSIRNYTPKFTNSNPCHIHKREIEELLDKNNVNKSPGPEYISINMIKHSLPLILPMLQSLFNKCIQIGYFPEMENRSTQNNSQA